MNLRNVFALYGFFLLSPTSNTICANKYWRYLEEGERLCASHCIKSLTKPLAYILELKDQIKERDSEIKELRKQLLEINNCKDQVRANNQQMEYLSKTNEDLRKTIENLYRVNDGLRESVKQQNQFAKIEEFITNTINNQKAEIEDLKLKESNVEMNFLTVNLMKKSSKDSCKWLPSGIHIISISGLNPFLALCNGEIADDGGWMAIHRRFDGSENFQRNWADFRNGFGSLEGEFFIGLEILHRITNSETYELYVQIEHFNGTIQFASYDNFTIGNEKSKYELLSLGKFRGTALDQMKYNIYQKFSTVEQDNDKEFNYNCAQNGAWWYGNRSGPNLNGRYYNEAAFAHNSLSWYSYDALKSTQMLIRPKSKV